MLEEMRIAGLGVIDDAVLELGPGLSVVTGETGAGKTMVITGLNLLLGARADSGLVRSGASRAVVEGRFRIQPDGAAAARLSEFGGDLDDDGTLLISRSVGADGRSRAHAGGRAVPVAALAELANDLVTVHGQADQLRLLKPAAQRALLDRFAGAAVLTPLAAYTAAYDRHREVVTLLHDVTTRARERAQEADRLRFGIEEIAAVGPDVDEAALLEVEIERLANADSLRTAARTAHAVLLGEPDVDETADAVGLIAAARNALEEAAAHDPTLADVGRRIADAGYLLADAATELSSYADRLDADPVRLATAQERKSALTRLIRKYDETTAGVAGVRAWSAAATARLAELDGDDDRVVSLTAERDELAAQLGELATAISTARQEAAARFAAAVAAELADLAMPDATLVASVNQIEADNGIEVTQGRTKRRLAFGPAGVDDVEFLLSAHTGAPPRPLQRGASGGELSRVMLAIEVVLADTELLPTFVFDEVDAGVGGRAAVEVGRRLAQLAAAAQVIVVTHLPQVAAYADSHLLVEKTSSGAVTRSGVTTLDETGRVAELSRMLAGLAESELARGHAEELLEAAAQHRASLT